MVKKTLKQYAFLIASFCASPLMSENIAQPTTTKLYTKPASPSKKIWFQFKDEPLSEVVNYLAQIMKINMVLPAGDEALSQKLTYQLPEKITISTAWEHVLTVLKVAGYSVINQNNFYYVKKNGPNINKESLPLYIQTPAEQLPNDDQRIRLMYYFSNINVASSSGGGGSPIATLLQNMLSTSASFMFETSMNAVIISDYSRNVRSAMKLLERLDTHGPTESVIIIPLKHVNAAMVAQLFQQLIPASGIQTQSDAFSGAPTDGPTGPSTAESQYFSQSTRIVSIPRNNSLVIMGKKEALEHIKNFIKTNIDVPLKKGESVIHIYPLEYLDAQTLAPILQKIVSSQNSSNDPNSGGGAYGSSTGQSTTTSATQGNERFFNGVIIMAEPISQTNTNGGSGSGQSTWWTTGDSLDATFTAPPPSQRGGNRLIVAATQEDWVRIKKLIKEMDIQQPQIALEVLVVDLTLSGIKVLGSQLRNIDGLNWTSLNAQTSHLGSLVVTGDPTPTAADALKSDLLEPYNSAGDTLASQADAGSLILALRDKGTDSMWWVAQILRSANYAKVLAQPFAIALNNQLTSFGTQESRILSGNATVVKGANVVQLQQINAKINLAIQPRISENGNINLGLNISISQFTSDSASNGNQDNRQITTNANVKDGEVLILGGLTKNKLSSEELETPILGKIPVLKWFFARKQKTTTKDNLMVFICAKKMTPSANAFYDIFTASKIEHATNVLESHGETFESLRDPINRWFFGAKHENVTSSHMTHFGDKKMFNSDKHYKEEFLEQYPGSEAIVEQDPGITQEALDQEEKFYDSLVREYIGKADEAPTTTPTHTVATAPKAPTVTSPKQIIAKAPETPELDIPTRTVSVEPAAPAQKSIAQEEQDFRQMLAQLPMPV